MTNFAVVAVNKRFLHFFVTNVVLVFSLPNVSRPLLLSLSLIEVVINLKLSQSIQLFYRHLWMFEKVHSLIIKLQRIPQIISNSYQLSNSLQLLDIFMHRITLVKFLIPQQIISRSFWNDVWNFELYEIAMVSKIIRREIFKKTQKLCKFDLFTKKMNRWINALKKILHKQICKMNARMLWTDIWNSQVFSQLALSWEKEPDKKNWTRWKGKKMQWT